ncbi:divergent PAP2 family protein [Marinilactibacillus sp. Marseille-P9653]|uniref:divergent PAP2 family protein n=1 Tax=Marinilactibacillus sp. Marseille-P9653 TaxID=2866583 RepID=UPI001CE4853B|nr:divergent PAP2 family protein [Marinilactibacillus sp. Marseille-P9653]
MTLFDNYPLIAALGAIFITQIIKIPVAFLLRRPTSFALATSTGGMPSSHSAGVTALITGLIIEQGYGSPLVAIAATFGVIVIFDSMGVRRQSGEHGILINELIADFENLRKTIIAISQDGTKGVKEMIDENRQSTEFLGHKPIEVFFGILSGILIAILINFLY